MPKKQPIEKDLRFAKNETNLRLRLLSAGLAKLIADNESDSDDLEFIDRHYQYWRDAVIEHQSATEACYRSQRSQQ